MGCAGAFDILLKGRKNLVRKDMERYDVETKTKSVRSFRLVVVMGKEGEVYCVGELLCIARFAAWIGDGNIPRR
jgi:hypothetical protein